MWLIFWEYIRMENSNYKNENIEKKGNIWYDWLIFYVHEPIWKIGGIFKDKSVSLFKANAPD